jgi:hypothetical protein
MVGVEFVGRDSLSFTFVYILIILLFNSYTSSIFYSIKIDSQTKTVDLPIQRPSTLRSLALKAEDISE